MPGEAARGSPILSHECLSPVDSSNLFRRLWASWCMHVLYEAVAQQAFLQLVLLLGSDGQ
jgi:hypothetical protein